MALSVGIRDVAAEAGVSHQTVSRVLNDHPNVKAATRGRVVEAMQRLNYVAHNGARSMRSRRSRVIGTLISAEVHMVAPGLLPALENEARRQGMWMLVAFTSHQEDTVDGTRRLRGAAVDGIILVSTAVPVAASAPLSSNSVPMLRVSLTQSDGTVAGRLADIAECTVRTLLTMSGIGGQDRVKRIEHLSI
ncbi:LacI family DNA-binding transcriptional regulator [uncultured Microbacterium sp.]|uniref:LacI family DNA-binding transcriptional regulator n=1 Tax=uncultured Microbacterium sp. TaxID=191216 RepID=UPI0035CB058C